MDPRPATVAGAGPDPRPRGSGPFAYEEMVACSDGSAASENMVKASKVLAAGLAIPVRMLHADQGPLRVEDFEAAQLSARHSGLTLDTVAPAEQTPWEATGAIVEYFRQRPRVLPMVAARARHSATKALLGSVSSAVVRELHRPVLVMGPRAAVPEHISRVMVAVDGSHFCDAAVSAGASLAERLDVELWLVEVLEAGGRSATNLAGMAWKLGADRPELRVGWETLHGPKADRAIVDYVGEDPSTLLVAATHGRSALTEIVLGSVASGLVRHAAGPMLLVSPTVTVANAPAG